MPKRLVDGNAIATSKTIARMEFLKARQEYALMLTLATANGVFECEPILIHRHLYAYNRPDVMVHDVVAILDEYERVKALFRWQERGKTWGFFVGQDKPGRLPPEGHRERYENAPVSVPRKKLHAFISGEYPESIQKGLGLGVGLGIGESQNLEASPICGKVQNQEAKPEEKAALRQIEDAQKELRVDPKHRGARLAVDEALGVLRAIAARKAL